MSLGLSVSPHTGLVCVLKKVRSTPELLLLPVCVCVCNPVSGLVPGSGLLPSPVLCRGSSVSVL